MNGRQQPTASGYAKPTQSWWITMKSAIRSRCFSGGKPSAKVRHCAPWKAALTSKTRSSCFSALSNSCPTFSNQSAKTWQLTRWCVNALPDLLESIRQDLAAHPLVRECVPLKKIWTYFPGTEQFMYYYEDIPQLDSKLRILQNYCLIRDISADLDNKRYVFTEGSCVISASNLVIEQRQSRQHIWQLQYREQRYARHLSQPELDRRIRDIVLNLLTATIGGIGFRATEIAPDEIANESTVWLEKAAHMLEEMELRHGPFPAGFTRDTLHKEPLPDFASELAAKAAQRLAAIDIGPDEVLIKYGKRQYMESLYDSGALRIQPATNFADTNHNEAIQDDELNLALAYAVSREELMTLVTNPQILPSDAADQRLDLTLRW